MSIRQCQVRTGDSNGGFEFQISGDAKYSLTKDENQKRHEITRPHARDAQKFH